MRYRRKVEEVTAGLWDGRDPLTFPGLKRVSTRSGRCLAIPDPSTGSSTYVIPGEYVVTRADGTMFALAAAKFLAQYEPIE